MKHLILVAAVAFFTASCGDGAGNSSSGDSTSTNMSTGDSTTMGTDTMNTTPSVSDTTNTRSLDSMNNKR